jgi:hypothetical protein
MIVGLMGCSSFPKEPSVVIKTEYSYITIPSEYLKDCSYDSPPAKSTYLSTGEKGREGLLVDYSISLNKSIKDCNSQIDKARKFQSEMIDKLKGK